MDALGSNIVVHQRAGDVMRIQPRIKINDKTRFCYDGLRRQRLVTPMVRGSDGTLKACDWDDAFYAIADKLSTVSGGDYYFYFSINQVDKLLSFTTGIYGFLNFGHRPWWYRGHFCKKSVKKIISKRNNLKKRKKTWGWVKNTK